LLFAFICLTVACVVLGVLASRVERQRRAVSAILAAKGRVHYDHSYAVGSKLHWDAGMSPGWLRRSLGEDWFSSVQGVTLYGEGCNDAVLQQVAELPEVRVLALWAWAVPPPEDDHLGGKAVTDLPLAGVTDEGLRAILSLKKLERISLLSNRITDSGLKHFQNHPSLQNVQVNVDSSNCTAAGIAELKRHVNLE
jgi:hypothetical protein